MKGTFVMLRCHFARLGPFVAIAAAAACSHQQKPAAPVPVAAAARPPTSPPTPPSPPTAGPPPTPVPTPVDGQPAIFFDFDSYVLRDDDRAVLQGVSTRVRDQHSGRLRIEGNCDERGTVEYNLALGERRASAAQEYLLRLGIPKSRIEIVTYGAQRPKYTGHDELAWAKNRRDDFVVVR